MVAPKLACGFALSMWKENQYRENMHLDLHWKGFVTKTFSHFYHVGSKEKFRNEMIEALVLKAGYVADPKTITASVPEPVEANQLSIFL